MSVMFISPSPPKRRARGFTEAIAVAAPAPQSEGVLLPCPVCGQTTDSLKEYHYIRWCVYWVLGSWKQEVAYRACPQCMRQFLWSRCLLNALPANVAWLLGFLPRALYLIRDSYRPGHSLAVQRWYGISQDEPKGETTSPLARAMGKGVVEPAAAAHPYAATLGPPALIPARLTPWSWWAFTKGFVVTLAIGAGAIFVGAVVTNKTNNPLPLVGGLIGGIFSLFLAPYYGKQNVRKTGYRAAIAQYTEAIGRDPSDARTLINRANVYRMLATEYAWPQMTRRICRHALADYDEAIRLAPNEPDAHVGRVNALGFEQAIAEYTETIRLDPNNAVAYCARATAYNGLAQSNGSIADATEAIRLAPDLYLGYDARGFGFWHRGNASRAQTDYLQAVADFSEAIRLNPNALDCYLGRAQAYRALGEVKLAAADEDSVRAGQGR
jgi:tetratricopeptide (TPR) repeat protein